MRKYLLFSVLFVSIVLTSMGRGAEIHLEHSFTRAAGGSSWGTEDAFKKALTLPASDIPPLYKQLFTGEKPLFADVSKIALGKGRFINQQAVLYKNIRFCMEYSLPKTGISFEEAKEIFLNNVAGTRENTRQFNFQITRVPSGSDVSEKCDILAVKGKWNQFPYRYLPDSRLNTPYSWKGKVFGLFYRHDEDSIPVITIHPDIELSYSPPGGAYVTEGNRKLIVDGRVLLLHEIGHIFGFSHIKSMEGTYDFPEATVMGLDGDDRKTRSLNLRFIFSTNLWKYWDAYQTTVYRRVYQQRIDPTCSLPTPREAPSEGTPLVDAVNTFNKDVDNNSYPGSFHVTEKSIRIAIEDNIFSVPPAFCADFQASYLGKIPPSMRILLYSGTSACNLPVPGSVCPHFIVNLEAKKNDLGYSVGIKKAK